MACLRYAEFRTEALALGEMSASDADLESLCSLYLENTDNIVEHPCGHTTIKHLLGHFDSTCRSKIKIAIQGGLLVPLQPSPEPVSPEPSK